MTAPAEEDPEKALPQAFPMEEFLDRLMMAESGGRLRRKNPRSTALGPFQFIESTFLFVVNRHFSSEVAGLTKRQILARRTDMAFSRRVARAYVHDLIAALASNGLPASPVNARIAFLVGPSAAMRLLGTPPESTPQERAIGRCNRGKPLYVRYDDCAARPEGRRRGGRDSRDSAARSLAG
ncbi:MAG: hypothetical protein WAN86_23925 [Hyphomicrobiaceae bacterium]